MEKFSGSMDFDASAEDTVALVASEDYMRFRYDEPDLLDFSMDVLRDDEEGFECRLQRTFALRDGVPRVIRRVVGSRFTLQQEHNWQRKGPPYLSSGRLSVNGAPGDVTVQVRLEPTGENSCRLHYEGTINAGVPVIGGQIERFLLERVDQSVEGSFRAMADALEKGIEG